MRKIKIYLLNFLLIIIVYAGYGQSLSSPESIVFDAPRNRYLISNAGNGTIITMNLSGQFSSFVSSLTSPKGMVIVGNILYVTDVTSVKGYSLINGAQTMNVSITGASFLNDIVSGGTYYLYVSDMNSNIIFRVNTSNSTYSTIVSSGINKPNGLLYDAANFRLILCTYNTNALIQSVDLSNNSVTTLKTTSLSNFDGLARDDSGFIYVSSWGSNAVYRFNSSFSSGPDLYATGFNGPADIFYNTEAKVLAIPSMNNNQLFFKSLLYPTVLVNGALDICPGSHVGFSAPKGSALNYSWKRNGTQVGTNDNYQANQDGDYSVTITNHVTSVTSSSYTVTLLQRPPIPTIQLSGSTNICLGDSVKLEGPSGYKYFWSDSQTTLSIIVKKSRIYTLIVYDTVNLCASDPSAPVQIIVNPSILKPVINVLGNLEFCSGDSVLLEGPSGFGYIWSNGKNTRTISVKDNATISLKIYDNFYCQSYPSDSIKIKVNEIPAKPKLTISGKTSFCKGDSVIISAPTGFNGYLWSGKQTASQVIIKNNDTVFVKIINNKGCISNNSDTAIIKVYNLPEKPKITYSPALDFCEGDSVVLTAPLYSHYLWSNGDTNAKIVVKESGSFDVKVTDLNACQSPASEKITTTLHEKPEKPKILFSVDTVFCENDSVILFVNQTFPNYLWSDSQTTKQIVVKKTGIYQVKVSNQYGCFNISDKINTSSLKIPVKPVISKLNKDSLISSVAGTHYRWYYNSLPLSFDTIAIPILGDGTYRLVVFNIKCPSDTSDVYNYIAGGIGFKTLHVLKLFPVPFNDNINIDFGQVVFLKSFQIIDLSGKILVSEIVNNNTTIKTINHLNSLSKGIYFIEILTENDFIRRLIMKE